MALDEAHEALANDATRRLVQITIEDAKAAHKELQILLGSDAKIRYDWVVEHINFDETQGGY